MKSKSKAPGTKRLTLNCDEPLSSFAFKFNLRRYAKDFSNDGRTTFELVAGRG